LPAYEQASIIGFLKTLQVLPPGAKRLVIADRSRFLANGPAIEILDKWGIRPTSRILTTCVAFVDCSWLNRSKHHVAMNAPLKLPPQTATVSKISGLPGCFARFRRRQTVLESGAVMFVSGATRCVEVDVEGLLSRLRAGLLALTITAFVVALPTTRSRADSVGALANLTGASTSTCEGVLTDLTGGDSSMLLDGLMAGEAEELLELVAHLAGLTPAPGTNAAGIAKPAFRDMAEALEEGMPDHLWYGQIFLDIRYADTNRIPGQVVDIGPVAADSAIWSGHYLAAEAFRYALARNKVAKAKNHPQASVWGREMARARQRVNLMVAGAHRNLNISKNWKAIGLYSPAFDGEAGMLFRNSFPEGVPTWQQNQGPNRDTRIFGPVPWDDGTNYYCMSSFTRDQYTGCVLGLLMTFDLVGPDDASLRAEVGNDLMTMADYLVRHEWSVVRPQNTPQDATPAIQPLGNGISWVLFMTEAARHAAWVADGLTAQAKWEATWTETLATFGPFLVVDQNGLVQSPNQSYFSHNLSHGQAYNNIRLEPDPAVRDYFRQCFSMEDSTTKDDGNAYFEAVTYALTGESQRLNLAVQHLQDWLLYYARWTQPTDLSARCGIDFQCIPQDQVTYEARQPDGTWTAIATKQGTSTQQRTDRVLRIADERQPQDFLWQRTPYQYTLAPEASPLERNAGVDFLLPYYILRFHTEVAPPAYAPWPEYPQRSR